MYMRKLCQYCPRFFRPCHLRATALSQNAALSDQSKASTVNMSEDQHTSSSDEFEPKPLQLKDITERKAKAFLANLDEDGLKRMEEIKMLIEMLRLENKRVPDELKPQGWKVLLTEHHTVASRSKYLAKLFLDECKQKAAREKKLLKQKARQEKLESLEINQPPQSSVHIPARDVEQRLWKTVNVLTSDLNVVFDLDFKQTTREIVNASDQIQRVWSNNLNHIQPLNIHLTSIHMNERLHELVTFSKRVPVNYYEESFQEIFHKDDLIYLTPDGPPMMKFDPSYTYIIGGLVDLSGKSGLTYGKARKYGVRMASFPLDTHCDFSLTNRAKKTLTLDCVHNILADLFLYHSWKTALRRNLNERYVFREDLKSEEFVKARVEMKEKGKLAKFRTTQSHFRQILDTLK